MATITVEEYLHTSYDPEVEYVDGILVERHNGDWAHSRTHGSILGVLHAKYRDVIVLPSLTVRISETRYRIPDLCVVLQNPRTPILREAPFLVVEVLCDQDRVIHMLDKLKDYAAFGARNIWLIDPYSRRMYTFRENTLAEVERLATSVPRLELTAEEVFAP